MAIFSFGWLSYNAFLVGNYINALILIALTLAGSFYVYRLVTGKSDPLAKIDWSSNWWGSIRKGSVIKSFIKLIFRFICVLVLVCISVLSGFYCFLIFEQGHDWAIGLLVPAIGAFGMTLAVISGYVDPCEHVGASPGSGHWMGGDASGD